MICMWIHHEQRYKKKLYWSWIYRFESVRWRSRGVSFGDLSTCTHLKIVCAAINAVRLGKHTCTQACVDSGHRVMTLVNSDLSIHTWQTASPYHASKANTTRPQREQLGSSVPRTAAPPDFTWHQQNQSSMRVFCYVKLHRLYTRPYLFPATAP